MKVDINSIAYLRAHLPNQKWRLNNLYHIIDESGKDVVFKMRPAQEKLYDNLWYRNIILKARQLGFTTFIDILGLDNALFTPNYSFSVSAETLPKAEDIFDRKIAFPYSKLPKEVQEHCRIVSQTKTGEMVFSNGSSVKVSVSARSSTVQFLHVSEYGIVCANTPAKGKEVKTGSIPAVPKDGIVFIESTARGNAGYFYDMVRQADRQRLDGSKLTPLDFKLHFFAWHENPGYRLSEDVVVPERLQSYFDSLFANYGIELSDNQQAWYVKQEASFGETMWSEYPSYPEEAFKVAQDGAYYARPFEKIHRDNRICHIDYDSVLPVYTAWDLGINDDTAIWFFQFFGKEVRLIDYYENNGEGIPHYAEIVNNKGYRYAGHFAPHDIAVRELGTGLSRIETARKAGLVFECIPTNIDVIGGIEHCRELLQYCWFDDSKTEAGRKCLENYKKEWDEKRGCYRNKPLHDWCSHGADAFRTMAVAWKLNRVAGSSSGDGIVPGRTNKFLVKGGRVKI